MKQVSQYYIMVFLMAVTGHIAAQETISLEEAIKIALSHNAKLRTEAQWINYKQASMNSAYNYAPTQINVELGQFNSAYFDTGFGVSQTFNLPIVYRQRAAANLQEVKISEAYLTMGEAEIRQQVEELFVEYTFLTKKEALLKYQDSLYSGFLKKSITRFEKGESDILEKTTAEQQKQFVFNQLMMVKKMKDYLILHLEWLVNDGRNYLPDVSETDILKYNIFYDSFTVQKHPVIRLAEQEFLAAKAMTRVERLARLPEFMIGYRNVSIRGTGADNWVYQGSDRFSSFQVGVGLPIFQKGIRSSIQSAQMMEKVRAYDYEAKKGEILKKIQQQYLLYNETLNQLTSFEEKALPNAQTIRLVSEKQFANGQINYLEYVMLTNQAITIESNYLELKRDLNMYIIELHYLTINY